MNIILHSFLIIGLIVYFLILLQLIKQRRLDLKYTLLWFFSGVIMLVIALFPQIMVFIINLLGIVGLTNGLFALIIFFILIIMMSITAIVSKMKNDNRKLIQKTALLEMRVRKLEEKFDKADLYKKLSIKE